MTWMKNRPAGVLVSMASVKLAKRMPCLAFRLEMSLADESVAEDIGLLTQPVEPGVWLAMVRDRDAFVADLDDEQRQIARCNPGDRYAVSKLIAALQGT